MTRHKKLAGIAGLTGLAAAALLGGCSSGAIGNAVRPSEKTVSEARGGDGAAPTCGEAPKYGSPLVVDWPSEKRGDLETAMKQGVGVVAYDCKGARLLPSCKARGSYGFMGISLKKETIELKTADELSANVPLGAVSLSASLSSSSSIAIDLRMVGVRATTRGRLLKAELEGDCEGATHFVQTATIGAFVVGQKTEGSVGGSVSAVGVGDVKGDSSSSKNRLTGDGELDACEKWDPDSDKPPAACQAVLRLQLLPVSLETVVLPDDKAGSFRGAECPEGFNFKDGKCVKGTGKGKQCDPTSEDDCERQCKLGHVGSCTALGRIYREGIGKTKKDLRKAVEPLQTACDADDADAKACLLLARTFASAGRELKADEARVRGLARRASWLLQGSCGESNPEACWLAGDLFRTGGLLPRDAVTAMPLLEQGCEGGYARSCYDLAMALHDEARESQNRKGAPPPSARDNDRDDDDNNNNKESSSHLEERTNNLIKRACNGGYGEACYHLATGGKNQYTKLDTSRDPELTEDQVDYMQRACDAEFAPACRQLAVALNTKDKDRSQKLWKHWDEIVEKRCEGGMADVCLSIATIRGQNLPGMPADPKLVSSSQDRWRSAVDQRCQNSDAGACYGLWNAFRYGQNGTPKDLAKEKVYAERYRKASERLCSSDNTTGCFQLATDMMRAPDYDGFLVQGYLSRACTAAQPDAYACYRLGQLYVTEKKPPFEDDALAVEIWWRRACELGQVGACRSLAQLYDEGKVVQKNEKQAFSLYEHACKASRYDPYNCVPYEKMLADGRGTAKDPQRYFRNVKARCESRNDISACIVLSTLQDKGIGIKADKKLAQATLDTRVCNNSRNCYTAGSLHREGRLVTKDPKLAATYLKKGCDGTGGDPPMSYACASLGQLLAPDPKKPGSGDLKGAIAAFDRGCSLSRDPFICRERDRLSGKGPPPVKPEPPKPPGKPEPPKPPVPPKAPVPAPKK